MRKILLIGEVNDEMTGEFFSQLDTLLQQDAKAPVYIDISSGGGETFAALAIYGRIVTCPVKVIGTAYGYVQSAATLIFAACEERYAQEDTWFMVHEEGGVVETPSTTTLQAAAQQQAVEERHWNELMSARTGKAVNYWRELNERTTYFKARAAMKHGLVHKIKENK